MLTPIRNSVSIVSFQLFEAIVVNKRNGQITPGKFLSEPTKPRKDSRSERAGIYLVLPYHAQDLFRSSPLTAIQIVESQTGKHFILFKLRTISRGIFKP
jgi:hypothetical protein